MTGGRLPIDAWQVVVGTMRAPQFLMLSMTCKGLHEYIRDNHQLWRKTLLRSMGTYTREITVAAACPMPRSVGTLMLGLWIGAELQAARRDARRHAAGGLGVPGHCRQGGLQRHRAEAHRHAARALLRDVRPDSVLIYCSRFGLVYRENDA